MEPTTIATISCPHEGAQKETTSSTASLQTCCCGPECGQQKCNKPKGNQQHPIWQTWQYRVFLGFIATFALWVIIYFSVTLSSNTE